MLQSGHQRKIKIPYREGRCSTCFYDENKQEIEMEDIHDDLPNILTKKCKVKLLAQCNGVWFAGGKFGLSWKALQVRVKSAGGLSGYSFVDESDDEDDSGDVVEAEEETHDALDNQVADSSSEEESEEEEEEPVAVKVTKKGGRKKKRINK